MPLLIAAVAGALVQISTSILGRVMLALGLSFLTYSGLTVLIVTCETLIKTKLGGMPGDAVVFFAWMNLDKAMTMIFSAMATSFTIKGIVGGKLTSLVRKPAAP